MIRCVALGSELAGAFLSVERRARLGDCYGLAADLLGLEAAQMGEVVARISALTHDLGELFDTPLLSAEEALSLVEEAQELLSERNVESLCELDALRHSTSELEARTAALYDAGRRDSLTGVYNRGHFDRRFDDEFALATAQGRELALLFIDLDHFKRINDTHGHQAGDTVLKSTAALLGRTLRAEDLVARYGGEEFVVLLPGKGAREAVALGQRMLAVLRSQAHPFDGQSVVVTASIGLAVHGPTQSHADASALLAAADAAVYQAKRGGRDRLVAHGTASAVAMSRAG